MAKFYGPSIIFLSDLETLHLNPEDNVIKDGLIRLSTEAITINQIESTKKKNQLETIEEGKRVFLVGTAEKPWKLELLLRCVFDGRVGNCFDFKSFYF